MNNILILSENMFASEYERSMAIRKYTSAGLTVMLNFFVIAQNDGDYLIIKNSFNGVTGLVEKKEFGEFLKHHTNDILG